MDGLEQDAPATGKKRRRGAASPYRSRTWNRMFQGRTGTAIPSHM